MGNKPQNLNHLLLITLYNTLAGLIFVSIVNIPNFSLLPSLEVSLKIFGTQQMKWNKRNEKKEHAQSHMLVLLRTKKAV